MITSKDYKHFNEALKMAELSTYWKSQVGCVVVYKNKTISAGFNRDRTDPLQKRYNVYRDLTDSNAIHKLHAEVDALKSIMDLDINWSEASIYVYRKRRDRPHGIARPCKSCMALIKDLGIKNIYFTTDDGFANEILEEV